MTPISRGCQLQVDKYVASHDGIATDRCKTRWSNVWCHSHGAPKLITHTPATTTGSVAIMISSGAVARRKAPTRSPWAFFQFAISDFTNKVARPPHKHRGCRGGQPATTWFSAVRPTAASGKGQYGRPPSSPSG